MPSSVSSACCSPALRTVKETGADRREGGMSDRRDTARSYDEVADESVAHIYGELRDKPLDRELLDRFADALRGGGPVCDVGCGPGHVARYLHDRGVETLRRGGKASLQCRIIARDGNPTSADLEVFDARGPQRVAVSDPNHVQPVHGIPATTAYVRMEGGGQPVRAMYAEQCPAGTRDDIGRKIARPGHDARTVGTCASRIAAAGSARKSRKHDAEREALRTEPAG